MRGSFSKFGARGAAAQFSGRPTPGRRSAFSGDAAFADEAELYGGGTTAGQTLLLLIELRRKICDFCESFNGRELLIDRSADEGGAALAGLKKCRSEAERCCEELSAFADAAGEICAEMLAVQRLFGADEEFAV